MHQEMDFRALLVKVQDCLSDGDRRRLHFLFGNVIPRQLRDDPSISGTLNVLESLFDRGLIDDHDFDFLTQAFRQIQCTDVVKRLEGSLTSSSSHRIAVLLRFSPCTSPASSEVGGNAVDIVGRSDERQRGRQGLHCQSVSS